MKSYRLNAAKAMAGCLILLALFVTTIADTIGWKILPEQFALIMLLGATATAAWIADPPQNSV